MVANRFDIDALHGHAEWARIQVRNANACITRYDGYDDHIAGHDEASTGAVMIHEESGDGWTADGLA